MFPDTIVITSNISSNTSSDSSSTISSIDSLLSSSATSSPSCSSTTTTTTNSSLSSSATEYSAPYDDDDDDIPPPTFDEVERQERLEQIFRISSNDNDFNIEYLHGDSVTLESASEHTADRYYINSEYQSFKTDPKYVTCQHCNTRVKTKVKKKFDHQWCTLCASLCICTLLCAWILPCCYLGAIKARFTNYQHYCPKCGLKLALYKMYEDPALRG